MLSALYIMLSLVRLSVTRVDQSITAEVRIVKISPQVSPIPLVFLRDKFHPASDGFPERGAKQGRDGENKPFSRFKRQYLENGRRYGQSYH